MKSEAKTVEEYLNSLPEERKEAVSKLREVVKKNLPKGFSEVISYGMIGYVVPHSLYPKGYHCNPSQPVPFINIGSQKNYVSFHHMGIYANKELLSWFTEEYAKQSEFKLDMGKGCVRFKKMDQIPFKLIGVLSKKISPAAWLSFYEKSFVK
jgi:uncharacterized protein YdhG (YjbR/CyaY superfamily)